MTQLRARPLVLTLPSPFVRPAAARRLSLAYLTTEYPKVSHTFIRREILELERRGHSVLRIAIRHGESDLADAADRQEASRTVHCLDQSKVSLIAAALITAAVHPLRWLRSLRQAWQMSRASDRGLLRHLAYLIEAAWLMRLLKRHQIPHLHTHFGTNAAAVARLAKSLGGPTYSLTIHGPDEFDSPRGFALREKVADASFVLAISDFCAAQIRRWADPQDWPKIHVVHCTINEDFLDHARLIAHDSNTLLCIGRLNAQKGQLLLIDAIKALIDDGADVRLILAGDGEMRPEIEERIAQHGLGANVEITGWIDEADVRRYLGECRALVQPSFAEGLPVVMMEALAMCRPVIASNVAGVAELVKDRENGWLIPAGNLEALVDAMDEALRFSTLRLNAMGIAGQRRVRAQHLATTEVDRLESLFVQHIPRKAGD